MSEQPLATGVLYRVNPRRLVHYRVEARLNVADAARLLGHSTDYLSTIESGQASVPRFVLERLAEVYACPIEALVDPE